MPGAMLTETGENRQSVITVQSFSRIIPCLHETINMNVVLLYLFLFADFSF